jgi:hypothetical protein
MKKSSQFIKNFFVVVNCGEFIDKLNKEKLGKYFSGKTINQILGVY